jgi:hypothetical protein
MMRSPYACNPSNYRQWAFPASSPDHAQRLRYQLLFQCVTDSGFELAQALAHILLELVDSARRKGAVCSRATRSPTIGRWTGLATLRTQNGAPATQKHHPVMAIWPIGRRRDCAWASQQFREVSNSHRPC